MKIIYNSHSIETYVHINSILRAIINVHDSQKTYFLCSISNFFLPLLLNLSRTQSHTANTNQFQLTKIENDTAQLSFYANERRKFF